MSGDFEAEWAAARAAWPGIDVPLEDFRVYVAAKKGNAKSDSAHGPDIEGAPANGTEKAFPWAPRTHDLYLACACSRRDSAAIAAFERAYFPEIDIAARRFRGRVQVPVDELRQIVRHQLFVPDPGAPPRIALYSGRGDLRSWFRVTVSRLILKLHTRAQPELPFDQNLLVYLLGPEEPTCQDFPKEEYKTEFRRALAESFAGLTPRDRTLLRYAFGEELTVEMIGGLYGVHKSTASRWVTQAHEKLLSAVRAMLVERLGISESEYASVLLGIRDSLELSLERYLKPASPSREG